MESTVRYQSKLDTAERLIRENGKIASAIVDHALEFYSIPYSELTTFEKERVSDARISDHTSVVQALKHIVRDWSDDGVEEREAAFPQIIESLTEYFPQRDGGRIQVLVPGSGLGRLSHDLSDLGGQFSLNLPEEKNILECLTSGMRQILM